MAASRLVRTLFLFTIISPIFALAQAPPAQLATTPPIAAPASEAISGNPVSISTAQKERDLYYKRGNTFSWLYWFLTVCAAGSAISTAIRSAYNPTKTPTNATNVAGSVETPMDKLLLGLAIGTVVATTVLSVVDPKELAARYHFGQLQLEKALFRYDSIAGPKTQKDVDAVTAAYFQAEDVLINGIQAAAKEPVAKETAKPSDTDPKQAPTQTDKNPALKPDAPGTKKQS